MKSAAIGPISIHLPEKIEDNDALGAQFPHWDMPLIYKKTGIRQRHIARPDECASDLGAAAAEKLFAEQYRPPHDRLLAVLHPDARLRAADDGLPDAGAVGAAHLDRPWTSISVVRGSSTVCRWPTG